jgi:SAM-dependent methyltransferase
MHLDVTELRAFYKTPLGRIARQIVSAEIRSVWPKMDGERLVGLGHTTPFLRPYMADAERVLAMMPSAGGVHHWPREGPNVTALAQEDELPLPDNSVDRLLLVHVLESARDPFAVLREAWRVLVPAGRILVIVPCRTGPWAQADHTPMGLGRPYSRFQLCQLLESAWLEPKDVRRVLFVPPSRRRFLLGSASAFERFGRRFAPGLAGLLLVEAQKTLVRGLPVKEQRGLKLFVPGLAPVPKPAALAHDEPAAWARDHEAT